MLSLLSRWPLAFSDLSPSANSKIQYLNFCDRTYLVLIHWLLIRDATISMRGFAANFKLEMKISVWSIRTLKVIKWSGLLGLIYHFIFVSALCQPACVSFLLFFLFFHSFPVLLFSGRLCSVVISITRHDTCSRSWSVSTTCFGKTGLIYQLHHCIWD